MAVDCDASQGGIQTDCTYAPGSTFNIEVHVTDLPAGGYFIIQAKLGWTEGVVNYVPAAAGDEALWGPCTIAASTNNWTETGVPSLLIACAPLPQLDPGDTTLGAVFTFEFTCKGTPEAASPPAGLDPDQSALDLISGINEPEPSQGGTFFGDSGLQELDPALTGATVTCGEVPPTDTPTAPDPTATPLPDTGVFLSSGDTVIAVGESTVLTFTVKDDSGNTVEGADCTFSILGPDGTDATLSSATGTTDANGDVSVTLTAGTTAETVQVEADCGEFGSFVQDVTVSPTLPLTGAGLEAGGGLSVGLWAMIGALLVAAAAGLTVFGWRSTRAQ